MKLEFSRPAGIVVKKQNGQDVILVLNIPAPRMGFSLKVYRDHIKDEKKEDTALREVEEETGVKGKIIRALSPVEYWYVFNGDKSKTVYYFLMEFISGDITKHDSEMENVEWLEKVESKNA